MNNDILLSVCIPVFNVMPYLSKCLDSIISQSLNNIEIICCDDCSSDGSYNLLLNYKEQDSRIKLYRNPSNKGTLVTRKKLCFL